MLTAASTLREASWPLEADPRSVSTARTLARTVLTEWGLADITDLVDAITLALSEIITNAIVHAVPPLTLSLHVLDDEVRGEVTDHSTAMPTARIAVAEQEGGRGLAIVTASTTEWGVDPIPDGKSVWCVWRLR